MISDNFELENMSLKDRDNIEIVNQSLSLSLWNIEFASERIKNCPEIILPIVKRNPFVFKLIGENLKNDRDFILQAIHKNSALFKIIPEKLQYDVGFVCQICRVNPFVYPKLILHYRLNLKIVLAVLETDPTMFSKLPNSIQELGSPEDLPSIIMSLQLKTSLEDSLEIKPERNKLKI